MKKVWLFSLCTLIVMLSILLLSGCEKKDEVSSVYLKDHDAESVIEMTVGNFDYSAYTLVVSHESGNTEEVALTEEMIKEEDLFKFYQEGEHEITVSYSRKEYVFKISVKRLTFGNLKLPENNVFTYDGTTHTVEVEGDMPSNAVVIYPTGNSFVNAGTYDVTAIVTCDGYVSVKLATTVTVKRAKYDMSGVTFEPQEFVYDAQAHLIEISGTLPAGLSAPTYMINDEETSGVVAVGEYTVTARFANSNPNYEEIPDMTTTLTITPAEFVMGDMDIIFKNEGGNVIDGHTKVYDGSCVQVDLSDYSNISSNITIKFSVLDAEGTEISSSNKNTNMVDTGVYTVKVEFTLANSENYLPIEPIVSEFKIVKAKYDMTNIHFDSDIVAYNGEAHSLSVDLPIDHDITAADISYEYYLDGELVVDGDGNPVQSVTEAGEYKVKAIFNVENENYDPIDEMEATLRIEATN